MPRFSPRFVIKHTEHTDACPVDPETGKVKCSLGYYTGHKTTATVPVYLGDRLMGHNFVHHPEFVSGNQIGAAQFATREDAQIMIANEKGLFGAKGCFGGCSVEENTQEQE